MRNVTLALVMTLGMATGCSTVKSGLSALGGGKPNQVTVVNTIEAPRPQVVYVDAPPVVDVDAEPVVVAPIEAAPAPRRSRRSTLHAVASGAFAGALVGTAVGYAVGGSEGAAKGAALGAGAGAIGGAAAHRAR